MGQTEAIRKFTVAKLLAISESQKGKQIPNWFQIDDMVGFGIRVTEGEVNFQVGITAYPLENQPGHFLIDVNASFMSKPVIRDGFEFLPMALSAIFQMNERIYAEDEQQLQDGMLQIIMDEADNIICRILQ